MYNEEGSCSISAEVRRNTRPRVSLALVLLSDTILTNVPFAQVHLVPSVVET